MPWLLCITPSRHRKQPSRQEVRMGELHERVNDMANRVAGVKTKSDLTETHFVEACDNIVKRYALKSEFTENCSLIDTRYNQLDSKLHSLELAIAQAASLGTATPSAQQVPSQTHQPQTFHVGTPGADADTDPFSQQAHDPWQSQSRPQSMPTASATAPGGQQAPPMPAGWGSAQGDAQARQSTPFQQPSPPGFPQPHHASRAPSGNFPNGIPNQKFQFLGDQDAMGKKSESLKRFSGNASDFFAWSKHFVDHMCKVHGEWRRVLEWIPKHGADKPFRMSVLRDE